MSVIRCFSAGARFHRNNYYVLPSWIPCTASLYDIINYRSLRPARFSRLKRRRRRSNPQTDFTDKNAASTRRETLPRSVWPSFVCRSGDGESKTYRLKHSDGSFLNLGEVVAKLARFRYAETTGYQSIISFFLELYGQLINRADNNVYLQRLFVDLFRCLEKNNLRILIKVKIMVRFLIARTLQKIQIEFRLCKTFGKTWDAKCANTINLLNRLKSRHRNRWLCKSKMYWFNNKIKLHVHLIFKW